MNKKYLKPLFLIALAWILWARSGQLVTEIPNRWEILDAFEEKKTCDERRAELVVEGVKNGDKKIGRYSVQPRSAKETVIIGYLCLPSTNFDPRNKSDDSPLESVPGVAN